MSDAKVNFLLVFSLMTFIALACGGTRTGTNSNSFIAVSNTGTKAPANRPPTVSSDGDDVTSETTEKTKPAAGKGNLQGKVMYNDKPAADIEVTLCEKFTTVLGIDCKGKTLKTRTDENGVFVLANAEPMEYQGLMAKVFKSDIYVYPRSSIMQAKSFTVSPDRTSFAADINLYKNDLKITAPRANAKVEANAAEITWTAYPDAAYYKVNLYPDAPATTRLTGERADEPSYKIDSALENGKYRVQVEAYNANDRKLAQSDNSSRFTVTGGAEPPPPAAPPAKP